jgi:putative FmdB family regulatory protein
MPCIRGRDPRREPIETVPTYDYQCRSCGQITEVVHSMTEEGPTTCERCGGSLRRVLYPTGIIFKGSGFYSTDSRSSANGGRRTATPPASGGATGSSSAPSAPASGSSEPKSEPNRAPSTDKGGSGDPKP